MLKYVNYLRRIGVNCNYNVNKIVVTTSSLFGYHKKYKPAKELGDGYKPHLVELNRCQRWTDEERFKYKYKRNLPFVKRKKFSMVLPPPNVTGNLHLGHALTATLQDVLARWKRMDGYEVLFVPGTDHAGIATQVVVEKYLAKKGIDRKAIGKDKFKDFVMDWKNEHAANIRQQLNRLGVGLDWSREVFTMDERHSEAVEMAFQKLMDKGLIKKDIRLVNWSCALGSVISDMEVETLEVNGPTKLNIPGYSEPVEFGIMYHIYYKLVGKDEYITVATTRPETMFGDVAIAVNPCDSRYKHLINEFVEQPLLQGRTLPIIGDDYVDRNYGSGAVKLTPAHDKKDFQIVERHPEIKKVIQGINHSGRISFPSDYYNMPRYAARVKIVQDLAEKGLLVEKRPHMYTLPICSRTGDVIEVLPLKQWHLSCKKMNEVMMYKTFCGALRIVPPHHEIIWNNWLTEDRDWCLSRQIWWGHPIPEIRPTNSEENPESVTKTNEPEARVKELEQYDTEINEEGEIVPEKETDVLDTWFSSGIYPFAALGWAKNERDYQEFYPLSLLVTGYDIACIWGLRMAMLGIELTGKLPFPKLFLHGIITDAHGRKMSKSKGNVINPEDVINGITLQGLNDKSIKLLEKGTINPAELKIALQGHKLNFPNGIPECGADALRLTLCEINPKNQLISFNVQKCHTNKLFGNKMWQSVKYFRQCYDTQGIKAMIESWEPYELQNIDLWILSRLAYTVIIVNQSLDRLEFHYAVDALKHFLYNEMCDSYIEFTKQAAKSNLYIPLNAKALAVHCHVFGVCFNTAFRCLSPFMPFLMEELISAIPDMPNIIHNYHDDLNHLKFPQMKHFAKWRNMDIERRMNTLNLWISVIRQLRSTFNIDYKIQPRIFIESDEPAVAEVIKEYGKLLLFITKCEDVQILTDDHKFSLDLWSYYYQHDCKIHLELPRTDEILKKMEAAREKLSKRKETLLKKLKKLEEAAHDKKLLEEDGLNSKSTHLMKIKEIKEDLKTIEHFQKIS